MASLPDECYINDLSLFVQAKNPSDSRASAVLHYFFPPVLFKKNVLLVHLVYSVSNNLCFQIVHRSWIIQPLECCLKYICVCASCMCKETSFPGML